MQAYLPFLHHEGHEDFHIRSTRRARSIKMQAFRGHCVDIETVRAESNVVDKAYNPGDFNRNQELQT